MPEALQCARMEYPCTTKHTVDRLRGTLATKEMKRQTECTLGVELEAWCTTSDGSPVNLWEYDLSHTGGFTFEPGYGSVEFVGTPAHSASGAVESILDGLDSLFSLCDAGWLVHHQPTPPFGRIRDDAYGPHVPAAVRPRYAALWEALRRETRERGCEDACRGVNEMKYHAATQLNFGSIPEHAFLLVYNVLHYTGPFRRRAICGAYGLNDPGGLAMWGMQGTAMEPWARPGRFTAAEKRWYADLDAYQTAFERNPLLLLDGKGSAACRLAPRSPHTYPTFGNPAHESNWWPDCRIRRTGSPMAEWVIEDRIYPAMSPQTLARVARDMLLLIERIIALSGSHAYETPADAFDLLTELSHDRNIGYLIPKPDTRWEPYSSARWLSDRIR